MLCSMELLIVVFCHNFSDRCGLSQKLHETRKKNEGKNKIFIAAEYISYFHSY